MVTSIGRATRHGAVRTLCALHDGTWVGAVELCQEEDLAGMGCRPSMCFTGRERRNDSGLIFEGWSELSTRNLDDLLGYGLPALT